MLNTLMARLTLLARAPVLLTVVLALPLWLVLDNIVAALAAASLCAALAAMVHMLLHAPAARAPETTSMPTAPWNLLPYPAPPSGLPAPDAQALAHTRAVETHLRARIAAAGGFLPFEQWMHAALYTPGLGYYAARATQFGAPRGDFTTAPELTPLFGASLAVQVAQVLRAVGSLHVLEFGAGSGALAASLIPALRAAGIEPHYHILEVSQALRARQQERLQPLGARVQWLGTLPEHFSGCVIANEVLDAMPATLFRWDEQAQLMELGVVTPPAAPSAPAAAAPRAFMLAERPAAPALRDLMAARMPPLAGYRSECNPHAEAWVRQLGTWLHAGAALLIDYGFPQAEYYHPQRAEGTLMCHLRHRAHADPLLYPGLQDITAHIDFTAMADAALAGGLEILGYTTQAHFLMNCGIVAQLAHAATAQANASVQTLLSEAEMGELFKVLAVGRGIDAPLLGFARGERSQTL